VRLAAEDRSRSPPRGWIVTGLPGSLETHRSLDLWVRIDPAHTITLFTGKVELGQGLRWALTRIGADELDVTVERIRVETADTAHGLDEGTTAGSLSLEQSGRALRQAAAEARAHLLRLAAAELGARPEELRIDDGTVSVEGRSVTYWDLLGGRPFGLEATGLATPKAPGERRITGRPGHRPGLAAIVTGRTTYIQDLTLPNMLHGRIVRPPSPRSQLLSIDEGPAHALPGVIAVVRDGSFLGVTAEREEQAIAAAGALAAGARWSSEVVLPPARRLHDWLQAQPAREFLVVGGTAVEGAVPAIAEAPGAARTLRATYTRPYLLHGSIGPSAAVARWSGSSLEVWSATQGVFPLRAALAGALRIDESQIRVRHVEGAGCYGHNGADDVALDAALLAARADGRPVRVVYTREQEHTLEPFGPAAVVELQASLDGEGRLLDWNHDVWSNSHAGRPGRAPAGSSGLAAAWSLADPAREAEPAPTLHFHGGIHRNADPLYAVPGRRIVKHFVTERPLRTSSLRSLGAYVNVFALESFIDEVAASAGKDPVDYRLSYLEDERARAALRRAAELADWPGPGSDDFGHGLGIAFARYKNAMTYAAVAVELHVDDETAEIALDRVVVAADAGEVIDPSGLRNQLEGGVVQAASWTLREAVTFDESRITSSDWDAYPILSFSGIPPVEVELIDHPELPPLGAGEATQGPTAAAIANAVHAAIGVRVRDLPITPDRIRAAVSNL
jgi:nicotinate dehydrogenase subunit B